MVRRSVFPCVPLTSAHVAIREPAPLPYFRRVQPGDVGYIRRGCFNLLFHAGCSLDTGQLGVGIPRTFKQLDVGPIFNTQSLLPGCLSTNNVRRAPVRLRISMDTDPYVRSAASVSSRT